MIDNSLPSQDDSGRSDQDESTESDTVEKLDTAKSNEIIEFIQNSQEFISDFVRGKDTTFNRYSDRLKALRCLTKGEVEETALADVATIESNRPEYGNVREHYHVIRFGPLLETVTKKVDYHPFTVQVKEVCLITIKPVIMSLETFVQNILVPEIIVKHEMKKSNCSYKEAWGNLYAGDLPTGYHEKILLHVSF